MTVDGHPPSGCNRFASEDLPIILVSDICDLMKTTRNGMENFGGNHKSCRSVVSDLFWGGSKEFPLQLPGGRDYLGPLYIIFLAL